MAQILKFPGTGTIASYSKSDQEKLKQISIDARKHLVENQIKEASEAVFLMLLHEYNLDPKKETFGPDFGLVIGAIRACLYRNAGLENPAHQIVDNIINQYNNKEEKTTIISEPVNVAPMEFELDTA